jgi:hypothetical protein
MVGGPQWMASLGRMLHCSQPCLQPLRAAAATQAQEVVALAEEKGSLYWKALGVMNQGSALALAGKASDAIEMLISGITAYRKTGGTLCIPFGLPHLARAHAELGKFEEAWRCIGEAMTEAETTCLLLVWRQ